jgi:hypothetical protein
MNILINPKKFKNTDLRETFLLNKNDIFNFKNSNKKIFFFLGIDLKEENPLLNLKINKLLKKKFILAIFINCQNSKNFSIYNFNNSSIINIILKGKHKLCTIIQNFLKKNIKNKKIGTIF